MRYGLVNLGQADPNTAVADAICKILRAASEPSTEEESQLYQDEFNKWYGKVANVAWMEDGVTERVGKFCPELVKIYNRLRADFLSQEQATVRDSRRPKLPPPPVGPRVPSVDPGGPKERPSQPTPTPTATSTSTSTPRATSQAPIPVSNPNQFPSMETPGYLTQRENAYQNTGLVNQVESYWSALKDYGNRPATPTIYEQTYTPEEVEEKTRPRRQDVASVQCPAGQFWDGRQCRGSVGNIPSLPGGLMPSGATSAASMTTAAPSSYGNYAGMSGARLGQVKQSEDVQFLKKKLRECIQEMERNPSQENAARCDEIQKLLTKAINKIQKREGVQNPGFMPQVTMQPEAFQQSQYSWNNQVQDIAPMATGPVARVGRGAGNLMNTALSFTPMSVNQAFLTPSFPGGSVGGYASMSGPKGYRVVNR